MFQKNEVQHNTRSQIYDYLTEALQIVTELEVDDDLRVPAFVKAVDLLAAKSVTLEQISAGGILQHNARH